MGLLNSAGLTDGDLTNGALKSDTAEESENHTQQSGAASNQKEQDLRADFKKAADVQADGGIDVQNSAPASTVPPVSADAAILAQAQAGDHAAFAQLYSVHKRRVYSLCLRMLGNVAEAEDLTQESFLQLH